MTKPLFPANPERLEKIAEKLLAEPLTPPTEDTNIIPPASINPADFLRIPGTQTLISREEMHKGLTWENTHFALSENNLYMPPPKTFMPYFLQVKSAAQGKTTLYDGNNKPIPRKDAKNLYKYLTTDYKNGCWTWLDAKFANGTGYKNLDLLTEHRVVTIGNEKKLQGKKYPLEPCLGEDTYAALEFNNQGLPKTKSPTQGYKQGENIYFYYPRAGYVAGFGALSGRAGLDCFRRPGDSGFALGVFACAEGARR